MVGLNDIQGALTSNAGLIGAGVAAVTLGGVGLAVASSRSKRKAKTRKGSSRDRKYISKQKHEQAYQRRRKKLGKKTTGKRYKKRKSSKRKTTKRKGKIYYTKRGQPYILKANGQAKFIKGRKKK